MAQDDYYGDGSAAPEDQGASSPEAETASEESNVALLPKSFFAGKELTPGTVCKVRIAEVQEDQVLVEYVPHDDEEAPAEPAGAPMDDEMKGYLA